MRDGRTRARFQKNCYAGGYLGSLDGSSVCPEAASAMFWDVVHPTSYTHCWVAYFVQRELARAGLARRARLRGRAARVLHRPHPAGLVAEGTACPATIASSASPS